jgi:hypothetical protein
VDLTTPSPSTSIQYIYHHQKTAENGGISTQANIMSRKGNAFDRLLHWRGFHHSDDMDRSEKRDASGNKDSKLAIWWMNS